MASGTTVIEGKFGDGRAFRLSAYTLAHNRARVLFQIEIAGEMVLVNATRLMAWAFLSEQISDACKEMAP